jgi:hypothetical protein
MEQLTLFKDMGETRNQKGYIVNEQGRECSKCGEFKLWSFFYQMASKRYQPCCKECDLLRRKKRLSDPGRLLLFKNIEKKFKCGDVREDGMVFKEYNITHSPKNNFELWFSREKYENHKGNIIAHGKRRRLEYLKIEKKYKRGDIRDDGMKFWEYSQAYASTNFEKWATESGFVRLQFNDSKRSYMKKSLVRFSGGKDEPSDNIIGLNRHDLSCYIESLFEDGMTWKNRGNWKGKWNPKKPKWHLDHIIPLDAANTLEEAKMLWHYTNLRPMWGNENLAKSNKHCKKELSAYLEERKADE